MEEPSTPPPSEEPAGLDTAAFLYDLNRKRRKPNFTEPELLTLVELWAQYKTILRGPATDTVMRSTKARVWRKITDEMNRRYPFVLRRVCDIRGKWEKLMCEARACLKVRGLQPCRDQPAASTQRKRPSRILRRIMAINWPQELDLMRSLEPQNPHGQSMRESAPVPGPARVPVTVKGPPTTMSCTPQLPQQQQPLQQHQLQANIQHPQQQLHTQQQQQQQIQQQLQQHLQQQKFQQEQLHKQQQQQKFQQEQQQLQKMQQQQQAQELQKLQQQRTLQQSPNIRVQQLQNLQFQDQQQHHPLPSIPLIEIKEDPDADINDLDTASEVVKHNRGQDQLASPPAPCPDELVLEESEEDVRREILFLQRTKLRKEIEKLDLELALLRAKQMS